MKLNDILKMLKEEGIKKEDLDVEKESHNICNIIGKVQGRETTITYKTKRINKKGRCLFVHTFSSILKGGLRRSGFSVVLYQLVKNLEQRLVSLVKLGYEVDYDKNVKKYCNIMPDYSMRDLERDGSFTAEDFKIFSRLKNQLKKPTTPEEEVEFIIKVIKIYKKDL